MKRKLGVSLLLILSMTVFLYGCGDKTVNKTNANDKPAVTQPVKTQETDLTQQKSVEQTTNKSSQPSVKVEPQKQDQTIKEVEKTMNDLSKTINGLDSINDEDLDF